MIFQLQCGMPCRILPSPLASRTFRCSKNNSSLTLSVAEGSPSLLNILVIPDLIGNPATMTPRLALSPQCGREFGERVKFPPHLS